MILTNHIFPEFLSEMEKCIVKLKRLPSYIHEKSLIKINPKNNDMFQEQLYAETEIKIENHDDLNDQIYNDSVSFLFIIVPLATSSLKKHLFVCSYEQKLYVLLLLQLVFIS